MSLLLRFKKLFYEKAQEKNPKNIMNESFLEKVSIEKASEYLFDFAIDHSDIKLILQGLPEDIKINRVSMEYEIQLLKILGVGWSISFFLDESSIKKELSESFWSAVQSFSQSISTLSSSFTGKEIDYFNTLKERLDTYLNALNLISDNPDPLVSVGPKFAEICGSKDNAHIMLSGSKAFSLSVGGVKNYFESVQIEPR